MHLLILHIPSTDIKINMEFFLYEKNYKLRGIVYYGNNHYTSRYISNNKEMWYHDGIQTGNSLTFNGYITSQTNLKKYNNNNGVLYIYTCK
jgi:hypothetical protein